MKRSTSETAYSVTPAMAWAGSDYILSGQAAQAAESAEAAHVAEKAKHRARRSQRARHADPRRRPTIQPARPARAPAVPAWREADDVGALFPNVSDDGADGSRMLAGWL